jgi:hypothetical protein
MRILQTQRFRPRYQAFAHVISSPEKPQTNAIPAMLIEENARFQFFLSTDQYGGALSVRYGVCSDKVFRLRGKVILLPTAPPKRENLRKVSVELSIADNHLRSFWPADNCGPGAEIG